jgi:hypothetical protein
MHKLYSLLEYTELITFLNKVHIISQLHLCETRTGNIISKTSSYYVTIFQIRPFLLQLFRFR